MRQEVNSVFFAILLMALGGAHAATPDAIATWAERSGDKSVVYSSELYGEYWTDPDIITQSRNILIAPAIGSSTLGQDSTQNMLAVWTELSEERSILKYSTSIQLTSGLTGWSGPQILSDIDGENLSPSIIHDLNGAPWVFWASTLAGNDDIYVMNKSNGSWSSIEIVNEPNTSPDILPRTKINEDGYVTVEWQSLDREISRYDTYSRSYPSKIKPKLPVNTNKEKMIKYVPPQAKSAARLNLHFPGNNFLQSTFFRPNHSATIN